MSTVVTASAAALMLLVACGLVAGAVARRLGLPHITGALLAGVILGPLLGVVGAADLQPLALVAATTLALIAVLAGGRLSPMILRETWRSAAASTAAQLALCAPLLALAFAAAVTPELRPLAALWGIVATTRSPIITVAVLTERRADGPLARHVLTVVVLQSAATLPLFFGAVALARGAPGDTHIEPLDVVKVAASVLFVALGFAIANAHASGPSLIRAGEKVASPLLTVFFSMAGASIDFAALSRLWPIALGLALLRALLTFVACRAGHVVARDPAVVRRYAWIALVPQAGVTVALAGIVAHAIPGQGGVFATLAIAVVALDEIVGAPLLRYALARAGEGR